MEKILVSVALVAGTLAGALLIVLVLFKSGYEAGQEACPAPIVKKGNP